MRVPAAPFVVASALAALCGSAAAAPLAGQRPAPPPTPRPGAVPAADTQRVVFVCEHGAVRSVLAAAHFNRLARARGLAARAVARGTAPDSAVPAPVGDGLRADGFGAADVAGIFAVRPELLRPADARGARLVVAFDQDVAPVVGGAPMRRWDGVRFALDDPRDYAAGRAAIAARVAALVAELERRRGAAGRP